MSLNGLDGSEVQQAYHAALTEAGGWLFVKYISRDQVDLLGSGRAGLSEARAAIAQYQEASPLYGLVVYRRRKVLVKYVPEETSRLLQARTRVHVRDVQDKWAPYETILEVATAEGVNDTALAAAFPLHTASPALSSNQLNEITEDNDEDGEPVANMPTHIKSIPSVSISKAAPSRRSHHPPSLANPPSAGTHSPILKHKSSLSQFLVREELGHKSVTPLHEHSTTIEKTASKKEDAASTASTRTESASLAAPSSRVYANDSADYDLEKYLDSFFKPKIALAPRPVNVGERSKRTTVSAPVSSLPAGIHSRVNKSILQPQPQRPAPSQVSRAPPRLPSLHFSPQITDIPDFLPPRPSSRGSSRSLPAPRASKSLLSPEKQRLMKALELRKKQMRNSTPPEPMPAMSPPPSQLPEVAPFNAVDNPEPQTQETQHASGANKADSGIDIAHPSIVDETQASVPVQPVTMIPESSMPAARHPVSCLNGADDIFVDSARHHSVPETKGETFVDSPTLGLSSTMPNIVAPGATNEQPFDYGFVDLAVESGNSAKYEAHVSTPEVCSPPPDERVEDTIQIPTTSTRPTVFSLTEDTEGLDDETPGSSDDHEDLQKSRRRGLIEPLHIDPHLERDTSEHKFLADDDFMDELQTATFEQATPIAMSKSPASPFFPRPVSSRSTKSSQSSTLATPVEAAPSVQHKNNNMAQSSVDPELLLPIPDKRIVGTVRTPSVSSAKTLDSDRSDPVPLFRRSTNVSSGISARIAALAESSSREGSPPVIPGSRKLSANSSLAQLKSSLIDHSVDSQVVSGADRRTIGKISTWPAAIPSDPLNHKTRSNQPGNRDSVSVTARIVRVPRVGEGVAAPGLQASPLLFNHTRSTEADGHSSQSVKANGHSYNPTRGEHDSVISPPSRDGITSRGSIETSAPEKRKSFDRKSFKGLSGPISPKKNPLKHSATMPPLDSSPDKASRTSRFFKRISHLGKDKRKSAPQVPVITTTPSEDTSPSLAAPPLPVGPPLIKSFQEPSLVPVQEPAAVDTSKSAAVSALTPNPAPTTAPKSKPRPDSTADVPPPVSVGDLNVQFPDTLLWKRRWVEIDSTGNLMFTANARHSNMNKNFNSSFHLKELSAPFIPDIDSQEMPHSVLFGFAHGAGSLQFASEDAMAQRQLLSLLTTYHQAWTIV